MAAAVPHYCGAVAVLRRSNDAEKLLLHVRLGSVEVHLERQATEPASRPLERLVRSLLKSNKRGVTRKKAKKEGVEPTTSNEDIAAFPVAKLIDPSGAPLPENLTFADAMSLAGAILVESCSLPILRDVPEPQNVSIIGSGHVESPHLVQWDGCEAEQWYCEWLFADGSNETQGDPRICERCDDKPPWSVFLPSGLSAAGRVVGTGWVLQPRAEWLGRKIIVRVAPRQCLCCSYWSAEVSLREGLSVPLRPWKRGRLGMFVRDSDSKLRDSTLRVGSWNILADDYAKRPYAREQCFPYCSAEFLDLGFRAPRILQEIVAIDADIMALQECTRRFFHCHIQTALTDRYDSRWSMKTGAVAEGVALLWDRQRFEIESEETLKYGEWLLTHPEAARQRAIYRDHWPHLLSGLQNLATVFQFIILKDLRTEGEKIIIGNTHLFFHPAANHIRLLQIDACVQRLAQIRKELSTASVTTLLVGDLNSTYSSGSYAYLRTQMAGPEMVDWLDGAHFDFGDDEAEEGSSNLPPPQTAVVDADVIYGALRLSFPESLAGLRDAYQNSPPEATNVVNGFSGTLDHMFYDSPNYQVGRLLEGVPLAELQVDGGLPSATYPSDHLALAVEFVPKK